MIPSEITQLTQITNDMVKNKPKFIDIYQEFIIDTRNAAPALDTDKDTLAE